jgi:hypothetical protein
MFSLNSLSSAQNVGERPIHHNMPARPLCGADLAVSPRSYKEKLIAAPNHPLLAAVGVLLSCGLLIRFSR